ncbi:MAG: hypothetical protein WBQ23_14715 [Bacteroidota bacterium]
MKKSLIQISLISFISFIPLVFLLNTIPIIASTPGGIPGDDPTELTRIHLPLQFIANAGQWDAEVQYGIIRGMDKAAFTKEGIVLFRPQERPMLVQQSEDLLTGQSGLGSRMLESSVLRFVNPSPNMRIEGLREMKARTQFYIGKDANKWKEDVSTYRGIRYKNVWDGIDIEYEEHDGKLVQRIIAGPAADLNRIAFTTKNLTSRDIQAVKTAGAGSDSDGEIVISGDTTRVRPYRNFFEKRKVIETEFNTYFGGNGYEAARGLDIDDEGNIHLAILTSSTDLPVKSAFQPVNNLGERMNLDNYIIVLSEKLEMIFGTYLGGTGDEWGAVPNSGNIGLESNRLLAIGDSSSTHLLCNTMSTDFPITEDVIQTKLPPLTPFAGTYCAIVRLSGMGKLDASTWLGNPKPFLGVDIEMDSRDNIVVLGLCRGEQWFVTPGSLQDAFMPPPGNYDSLMSSAVIAKITSKYDSIIAGTYLFSIPGFSSGSNIAIRLDAGDNVIVVASDIDTLNRPPEINSWQSPFARYSDAILVKIDSDLSRYIFTTWLGGWAEIVDLAIDPEDNIILAGNTDYFNRIPVVRSLSSGPHVGFIIKFPPEGGEPVFSTYLPWTNVEGAANNPVRNAIPLRCGDIFVLSYSSAENMLFERALDTVRSRFNNVSFTTLEADGQSIRSSGYWHADEKYAKQDVPYVGLAARNIFDINFQAFRQERNNNLIMLGRVPRAYADSITLLRAFQSEYAGGDNDMFLIRTRIPGCEIMTCGIDMPDTVRIYANPALISPERIAIVVDAANIDPTRSADDIECVITLPAGLVLDPASQSVRQRYNAGLLRSGETARFTWTVRVDTSQIKEDGVWVDAVTYYRDAEFPQAGAPAASPCDFFLRFVRLGDFEPVLACTVDAPDSLLRNSSFDGYAPPVFPVNFSIENTGSGAQIFARFALGFGGNMGGAPVPPTDRYRPGTTLDPGAILPLSWQMRVLRRADDRLMQVIVTGEDELGNILSRCTDEIFIPGLDPLLCEASGTTRVRVNPETGSWKPDTIMGIVTVRQVLDTTLQDVSGEIDLSACRYLALAAGENPLRGPMRMASDESQQWQWVMELSSIPTQVVNDTVVYRLRAGNGRWVSTCTRVVEITPLKELLDCEIQLPSTLNASEVESRTEIDLDYTLSNVGTVPVDVDRLELAITPANAGLNALDAITLTGMQLGPGSSLPWSVRLRASILRAARNANCTVTAFGTNISGGDTVLSVCSASIAIEEVDGLRCAISATDSVRFERDSLRYVPDPLPIELDLSNILDTEETLIEAEIDLSNAPRFVLAAGENALKTLASIDSHTTAGITWLLTPQPGPTDESQDIRIRYRSTEQGVWKECRNSIIIEAWPEITEVLCATGGHDSLHADAKYEDIIPKPFEISYTATNSGTITLTNCTAAIILPPGFALAGSDSIQSFGTLAPGETAKRWWTLTPSDQLSAFGPYQFNWQWSSDEQRTVAGCSHTVQLVPDASGGIVFTPLHLYFEAEMGGTLPAAQNIQLWTGNGLSMPWTAQSDIWYIDLDPVTGDHAATIAVRPNTTTLNKGMHTSAIELAGTAQNLPKQIEVEYLITSLTGTGTTPAPSSLSLGPVYPHPIPLQGEARIVITPLNGSTARITLHDLLGRERAVLHDGVITESEVLILRPAVLGLEPGSYLLRLLAPSGMQSRMVTVVR